MKLIIFSHGKESGPDGGKIRMLRALAEQRGFRTESLDYRACKDANARVQSLLSFVEKQEKPEDIILVGSSMGGYVSMAVAQTQAVRGLFLLCPALYMPYDEFELQGYTPRCKNIELIHGWADEIVPCDASLRFAREQRAVLHLVDDNHRLKSSYPFIGSCFAAFLDRLEARELS